MNKTLRKAVSFLNKDEEIYCMTYNLDSEDEVTNLQWWIVENEQENFTYLYRILKLIRKIKENSKDTLTEKTVMGQLSDIEKFRVHFEEFNTKKISIVRKPYRNFVLLNENEIDKKITNYIRN